MGNAYKNREKPCPETFLALLTSKTIVFHPHRRESFER
jgi:hypothetical protein